MDCADASLSRTISSIARVGLLFPYIAAGKWIPQHTGAESTFFEANLFCCPESELQSVNADVAVGAWKLPL